MVKVKRVPASDKGAGITELFKQYVVLGQRVSTYAERQSEIKQRLMELLAERGEEAENGHRVIDLPEEINEVTRLVRQRRVSQVLDVDYAETELSKLPAVDEEGNEIEGRTMWDQCIEMVPRVDEDAILAFSYRELIPEEIVEQLYDEKETFAFVPEKAKRRGRRRG
jgi:hypothetical protein